jgi:hypothetical protein
VINFIEINRINARQCIAFDASTKVPNYVPVFDSLVKVRFVAFRVEQIRFYPAVNDLSG